MLVLIGPPVFAIGLVILIATGVQWGVSTFCSVPASTPHAFRVSAEQSFRCKLLMTLGFGALGAFFGYRLDINDFSMHAFYRDRIARCYAGASHPRRRPDPFTGFAASDADTLVSDLLPDGFDASRASGFERNKPKAGYAGPFPIFCSTVNLSFGGDLAWHERKGASFTFTPLYSGYMWALRKNGACAIDLSTPTTDSFQLIRTLTQR